MPVILTSRHLTKNPTDVKRAEIKIDTYEHTMTWNPRELMIIVL